MEDREFKTTSVRLTVKHRRRLDLLAEHLRALTRQSRPSRTVALAYLIEKALDDDGKPSWEATGTRLASLPKSYKEIKRAALTETLSDRK